MFNRKARAIGELQAVLAYRTELLGKLTYGSQLALEKLKEQEARIRDEATVNDILQAAFEAKKTECRVIRGENEKLLKSLERSRLAHAVCAEMRDELAAENAALLSELHELPEEVLAPGETWGIDVGGEG